MREKRYFKEGDVLIKEDWIFIYAGIGEPIFEGDGFPIVFHVLINRYEPKVDVLATRHGIGVLSKKSNIEFANRFDKRILHQRLSEHGYSWNSDRMELVKISEKPDKKIGESFYDKNRKPDPYSGD